MLGDPAVLLVAAVSCTLALAAWLLYGAVRCVRLDFRDRVDAAACGVTVLALWALYFLS